MKFFTFTVTLVLLLLIYVLYMNKYYCKDNQYVPANYVVMADEITDEVVAKLTKRYNMDVIGMGGGMAGCVNMIVVAFQIRGPIPKNELRKIIVDCIEEFLVPINANEKLRPFLKTFPYTVEGLRVEIFVVDERGIKVYDPNIMLAVTSGKEVLYKTVDKNNDYHYKTVEEEDYETALEIVKGKKS